MVLVRPGQESNSRPTSTEADVRTTRPRAGLSHLFSRRPLNHQTLFTPGCN